MSFDFFGKKPEIWVPTDQKWRSNYNAYLEARWPKEDRSTPLWYDWRMARFDLLRPLYHGSYDYAHEFFCATIFPIKALWFTSKTLFSGFLCLLKFDFGGALFAIAEVCASLVLISYSILISLLGLIIRPLLSLPLLFNKESKPLTQTQVDVEKTHQTIKQAAVDLSFEPDKSTSTTESVGHHSNVFLEYEEKSAELSKKCLQLSNYIAHEIERLTTSLTSYIEIKTKCEQITKALSKLKYIESNAKKYSHDRIYNKEEKSYAPVCVSGHPASRGCTCLFGHPVPFITRMVQRKEPVYISDDDARQKAYTDALQLESELQMELSKLSPVPEEYLHLTAITAFPVKLKKISETLRLFGRNKETLNRAYREYKEIIAVCRAHCSSFQLEDYLISNLQENSLFNHIAEFEDPFDLGTSLSY